MAKLTSGWYRLRPGGRIHGVIVHVSWGIERGRTMCGIPVGRPDPELRVTRLTPAELDALCERCERCYVPPDNAA